MEIISKTFSRPLSYTQTSGHDHTRPPTHSPPHTRTHNQVKAYQARNQALLDEANELRSQCSGPTYSQPLTFESVLKLSLPAGASGLGLGGLVNVVELETTMAGVGNTSNNKKTAEIISNNTHPSGGGGISVSATQTLSMGVGGTTGGGMGFGVGAGFGSNSSAGGGVAMQQIQGANANASNANANANDSPSAAMAESMAALMDGGDDDFLERLQQEMGAGGFDGIGGGVGMGQAQLQAQMQLSDFMMDSPMMIG